MMKFAMIKHLDFNRGMTLLEVCRALYQYVQPNLDTPLGPGWRQSDVPELGALSGVA